MGGTDPEVFHFPKGLCDREQIKEKNKRNHGDMLQEFQGGMYKNFILDDKEPNWDGDEYTSQRNF
jgi:hypothetical protein